MEFGRRLRDLRKQKNVSQRDLATQVGIDFTYLSKIEGGRSAPPSEEVIRHIAQVNYQGVSLFDVCTSRMT